MYREYRKPARVSVVHIFSRSVYILRDAGNMGAWDW